MQQGFPLKFLLEGETEFLRGGVVIVFRGDVGGVAFFPNYSNLSFQINQSCPYPKILAQTLIEREFVPYIVGFVLMVEGFVLFFYIVLVCVTLTADLIAGLNKFYLLCHFQIKIV